MTYKCITLMAIGRVHMCRKSKIYPRAPAIQIALCVHTSVVDNIWAHGALWMAVLVGRYSLYVHTACCHNNQPSVMLLVLLDATYLEVDICLMSGCQLFILKFTFYVEYHCVDISLQIFWPVLRKYTQTQIYK